MATEIVEYQNDQPTFSIIRDGIAGNIDIVGRMIDLVKDSTVLDKGVENLIKQRLVDWQLDSFSDTEAIFNAIYNFVKYGDNGFDGVTYIKDIQGRIESIKDARTTLQDGYGDCDDFSVLYATILSMLGYEPCFVIARYPDQETFSHIYTATYVNGERYVFDGILPNGHLNDEADGLIKEEICVYDETNEFNNTVKSVMRNIKNLMLQTKRNAKQVAPQLAGFLPAGFLVKQAARNMFSGISDSVSSLSETGSQLSGEITDIIIRLQNGNISKENALSYARKRYSELFSVDRSNIDEATFNAIERKLRDKISYIENFEPYGAPNVAAHYGLSTQAYVLIGIVGLGIYYFYRSNKSKF